MPPTTSQNRPQQSNQRPANSNTNKPSSAAIVKSNPNAVATAIDANRFHSELLKFEDRIGAMIPRAVRELDSKRVMQLALSLFEQSIDIQGCSLPSILNCVAQASSLGLEFNTPKQQAWLIPYKKICTLQIGYKGWMALAYRSGKIRRIDARVVVADDLQPPGVWRYKYGTGQFLDHVPVPRSPRFNFEKDAIAAYCLLWAAGETEPFFNVMDRQDIEYIRDQSSEGIMKWHPTQRGVRIPNPDSPWYVWPGEMWKKTVTKSTIKYTNLDPDTALAVGIDDESESGVRTSANLIGAPLIDLTPGEDRDWDADGPPKAQIQGVDPSTLPSGSEPPPAEWTALDNDPGGIKPSNQQQGETTQGPVPASGRLATPPGPPPVAPLKEADFTHEQWQQIVKDFADCGAGNISKLHEWLGNPRTAMTPGQVVSYLHERADRAAKAQAALGGQ